MKKETSKLYNKKDKTLLDEAVLRKLRYAAQLYEDGAILECNDELLDVINAIREFSEDN